MNRKTYDAMVKAVELLKKQCLVLEKGHTHALLNEAFSRLMAAAKWQLKKDEWYVFKAWDTQSYVVGQLHDSHPLRDIEMFSGPFTEKEAERQREKLMNELEGT